MEDNFAAEVPEQLKPEWASDVMVDSIRAMGLPYLSLNPGSSYRGLHDSLAGSSHADRREADSELFARAGAVYTDDLGLARAHSGDLRAAVAAGALAWEDVRHLGAALDGTAVGPTALDGTAPDGTALAPGPGPITVFCSHGVGSWDLELAMTALDRAEATGAGHHLDLDMGQWRAGG